MVPGPIVTCGPTIENAPTSTSEASSAPASTRAVGCMCAIKKCLLLRAAQCRHQLGLRRDLGADFCPRCKFADTAHHAQHFHLENELISGNNLATKAGVVDARKKEQRFA